MKQMILDSVNSGCRNFLEVSYKIHLCGDSFCEAKNIWLKLLKTGAIIKKADYFGSYYTVNK